MKKEWKICIAPYKLAYSILFLLLFALVRGVTMTSEIGPALMPGVAVLASVFCAETSVMDRNGQRWEIICLKPEKNRIRMIYRRWILQAVYLYVTALAAYFAFFWQKPYRMIKRTFVSEYGGYVAALAGTILFWSLISVVISNLAKSQWVGIGASVLLWITTNSTIGDRLFGRYNLFAYSFCESMGAKWSEWVYGTLIQVLLAIVFLILISIIEKRVSK